MARSHGRVLTTIWSDDDFLALGPETQRMYMLLLSQPGLTHAGTIDITVRRWSKLAAGSSEQAVRKALGALEAARFIVVDWDTEEILIRSLIRNDNVWRQPNVMRSARDDIRAISSPTLRAAVRVELARLDLGSLEGKALEIVGGIVAELLGTLPPPPPARSRNPSPKGSVKGSTEPSERADPVAPGGPQVPPPGQESRADTTLNNVSVGQKAPRPAQETLPGTLPETLPARVSRARVSRAAPSPSPSPSVSDGARDRAASEQTEPQTTDVQRVVAAWVEAATNRQGDRPEKSLIMQVARKAKSLLAEGKAVDRLITAAHTCGAAGYTDLGRELLRNPKGATVTSLRQVATARVAHQPTDGPVTVKSMSGAEWARSAG